MIDVYFGYTPNAFKVTIALEEMELPYRIIPVDVTKGEQFEAAFLEISPNNKIPAIIDRAPADGGEPFTLFESGAILLYLAQKSGKFMPQSIRGEATLMQWLMWQMAGFGPMLGQAHHFLAYAPEPVPYAARRYATETTRLYGVLDRRLGEVTYLCGDDYTIADMACWPWVYYRSLHQQQLEDYPNVARWYNRIGARTSVQKAMGGLEVRPAPLDDSARKLLFGL